eukprot:5645385-Ditylum_brightwellii.AAC.1
MILQVHSDASCLSKPKACSRAGGYFYLGNIQPHHKNRPLLMLSQILCNMMASAAEAELGTLFEDAKEAVVVRTTLRELGHQQPATPIQVDNYVAHGIVNSNIRQQNQRQ